MDKLTNIEEIGNITAGTGEEDMSENSFLAQLLNAKDKLPFSPEIVQKVLESSEPRVCEILRKFYSGEITKDKVDEEIRRIYEEETDKVVRTPVTQ